MRIKSKNLKILFWLAIFAYIFSGLASNLVAALIDYNSPLVINEIVAANKNGLADEDGDYSDWIEIYNRSGNPVNLSGWALTDDPGHLTKWTLPNLTLGSGQYLLVFASGKDRPATTTNLHANFKLRQSGEYLALFNILDQQAESLRLPEQFNNISYGRRPGESALVYFANPTPGQPNDDTQTWAGLVSNVQYSLERGFYSAPFTLTLTTATPEAVIRYTTDGSRPGDSHGSIYTGPILITTTTAVQAVALKPNFLPSYLNTHTYIFLNDVLKQPATPPGFPATWGVHTRDYHSYTHDYFKGTPVIPDYEMDPQVVNDPRYRNTIADDLKSIPSLSLVMDIKDFTDIYANPTERGQTWERPVSAEFIYPDQSRPSPQINAGLRIQGGWGRWQFMPKHSFRLFFKDKYGAGKFNYPLFPNSPVKQFDTLILRAGTGRSFAGKLSPDPANYWHHSTAYTRDEWLRASQIAMSGVSSHGIFVHLYINGLYWGLYNVVERPDAAFMAAHFGGDKDDWQVINHNGPLNNSAPILEELETELYRINNLNQPQGYLAVQQFLDTAQFADYIILSWYAGMREWPENNWYAGARLPFETVKFFVWDGENTWRNGAEIYLGENQHIINRLFNFLVQYPDFRIEFADRLYRHLFNNGALTDANSQARWREINQTIDRAIVGESARWGDSRFEQPITRADWLKARDEVLAQMEGNAAKLVALTREIGLYPSIDPPRFNQHGGLVSSDFKFAMSASEGIIYYTLDGSDPRMAETGASSPLAKVYAHPISITTDIQIKARLLAGNEWSALAEATFTLPNQERRLRLTEIMYNPADGDDYEFIELKNTGHTGAELAGLYFEGIDFTFPPGVTLAPSGVMVLVRNPQAFAEKYPNVPIGGVYRGKLSNSGETITVKEPGGNIVISVSYNDENGWPLNPDGRGGSLVIINPDSDPNNPANWRASSDPDGSPGKFEMQPQW